MSFDPRSTATGPAYTAVDGMNPPPIQGFGFPNP